ncbi:hypothetical protein HKX48_008238 [Thoreauomyces humboldtii]|nr:hypothetical protein HKX48_008238 [Thoreauomyces humboldtii]
MQQPADITVSLVSSADKGHSSSGGDPQPHVQPPTPQVEKDAYFPSRSEHEESVRPSDHQNDGTLLHAPHHDNDDTESLMSDVSDVSDLGGKQDSLTVFLEESGIPVSQDVVDPHLKGLELQTSVLSVLMELMPKEWDHVENPSQLKLERVSGAMTNCIYFVTGPRDHDRPGHPATPPNKVVLRIYGAGAGQFIKRDREMYWLVKMSEHGVAPRLLGAFANGRFEHFVDSVTLTKEDFRDPETSRKIAVQLYKLHQLIHSVEAHHRQHDLESTTSSDLWNKLRRWQKMALKSVTTLKRTQPDRYKAMRKVVDVKVIPGEIDEVEDNLHGMHSPLVFAHNDCQYGNVLRKNRDGAIVVVDYEYSSINYRGYDVANHFCEWAADYHCPTPHKMDFGRYPTREEQDVFFNAYMDAAPKHENVATSAEDRQRELTFMRREADKFRLASHLIWGLWGLMQASQTDIDFDYVGYACTRFAEYWRIKKDMLAL